MLPVLGTRWAVPYSPCTTRRGRRRHVARFAHRSRCVGMPTIKLNSCKAAIGDSRHSGPLAWPRARLHRWLRGDLFFAQSLRALSRLAQRMAAVHRVFCLSPEGVSHILIDLVPVLRQMGEAEPPARSLLNARAGWLLRYASGRMRASHANPVGACTIDVQLGRGNPYVRGNCRAAHAVVQRT
jgi:hypothetical protein